MPSGRCRPSGFGIYTRRDGCPDTPRCGLAGAGLSAVPPVPARSPPTWSHRPPRQRPSVIGETPTAGCQLSRDAGAPLAFLPNSCSLLHVCGPAPSPRLPDSASGPCFAVPHSSRSRRFPPPTPPQVAPQCSPASSVLSAGLTSAHRASSASASRLPDAARQRWRAVAQISRFPYRSLPYMPGSQTTWGRASTRACVPTHVAFCLFFFSGWCNLCQASLTIPSGATTNLS